MEDKKKKTQTGKKQTNTSKKVNATKTNTTKKVANTSKKTTNKPVAKKTAAKTTAKKTTTKSVASKANTKQNVKKVAPKKEEVKKTTPKKIEIIKEEVKEEVKPVETKESLLEKTIIFDGQQKANLKEVVEKLEEENVVVEDKIIKRSKVRKILIIITAIAMVLVFAASLAYILSQRKLERHNNETTGSNITEKAKANKVEAVSDTESEPEDNAESYENIVTITLAQFESKAANKEDMIVLVASSSCSACVQYEPTVNDTFKKLDKKIYRLDIKSMSESEIDEFRTYYAFHVTPTIFVVKDGIVSADTASSGRMTEAELTEWLENNA